MPIYAVEERKQSLPRIGTIRKGIKANVIDKETKKPKKVKGKFVTYPKEVPYWVFNIDENDKKTQAALLRFYGEPETRFAINVFLPFPDAEKAWDYWLEAYTFSQLVARSDGRTVLFLRDIITGQVLIRNGFIADHSTNPQTTAAKLVNKLPLGSELPYEEGMKVSGDGEKAVGFKASGRLQVVVKELGRMATFTVMTGSLWYDIPAINSTIEMLKNISARVNIPANTIPLILRRIPVDVSVPKADGKRSRVTKYMIELELGHAFSAPLLASFEHFPELQYTPTPEGKVLELEAEIDIEEDYDVEAEVEEDAQVDSVETTGNPTLFWQHVRANGITDEVAKSILKETKNDFDKAYKVLLAQHTPPAGEK